MQYMTALYVIPGELLISISISTGTIKPRLMAMKILSEYNQILGLVKL